jgi:hypothetical protein
MYDRNQLCRYLILIISHGVALLFLLVGDTSAKGCLPVIISLLSCVAIWWFLYKRCNDPRQRRKKMNAEQKMGSGRDLRFWRQARILVADDVVMNVRLLSQMLTRHCCAAWEITTQTTADGVLSVARSKQFDLIIIDEVFSDKPVSRKSQD